MKLIGLVGMAGSGKSTLADIVVKEGKLRGLDVVRASLANGVKEGLLDAFPEFFSEDDFYTQEGKLTVNEHLGVTHRHILQLFGTEFARSINNEFWLKLFYLRYVKDAPENRIIIVDDCRFENEITFVEKLGGIVYFIERDIKIYDFQQMTTEEKNKFHESERCYEFYQPRKHVRFSNVHGLGELNDLAQNILSVLY